MAKTRPCESSDRRQQWPVSGEKTLIMPMVCSDYRAILPRSLLISFSVLIHELYLFGELLFRLQSNRACRHNVLDDHLGVLHHNPIYYSFEFIPIKLQMYTGPSES